MSRLPCEVVRDLLPSYIDELTSEVTNNLVEKHITECEECHQVFDTMNNPEAEYKYISSLQYDSHTY